MKNKILIRLDPHAMYLFRDIDVDGCDATFTQDLFMVSQRFAEKFLICYASSDGKVIEMSNSPVTMPGFKLVYSIECVSLN
jgi:hypothetical protein